MAFDIEIQTKFERFQKKLNWTINNFNQAPSSIVLESPPFSLLPDSSPWILQIDLQSARNFKIFFKKCGAKNTNATIVGIVGKVIFKDPTFSREYLLFGAANVHQNEVALFFSGDISFRSFLQNSLKLQGDTLIIECHITVTAYNNGDFSGKKYELVEIIPSNDEAKAAITEKMFKRNAYTDVAFYFGDKSVLAHKAVLTVTSPVFEKMFEHDTLENQTNTVSIPDVDIDVFKIFLEFVYTRKIKKNVESDFDSLLALYEVSDKYEVRELQIICANFLLSNFLNVERVCRILKLADLHADNAMKEILFKFLKQKFSEVVKTEEWSSLTTDNIKLASEVVSLITQQLN